MIKIQIPIVTALTFFTAIFLGCDVEEPIFSETNILISDHPNVIGFWIGEWNERNHRRSLLVKRDEDYERYKIIQTTENRNNDTKSLMLFSGFPIEIDNRIVFVVQFIEESAAKGGTSWSGVINKWAYVIVDLDSSDEMFAGKLSFTEEQETNISMEMIKEKLANEKFIDNPGALSKSDISLFPEINDRITDALKLL